MNSKELVATALHVLVTWNDGRKPAPAELQILKEAFPFAAHLPVDELCCWVIHDLSAKTFQEHSPAHQRIPDKVA